MGAFGDQAQQKSSGLGGLLGAVLGGGSKPQSSGGMGGYARQLARRR